MCGISGYFSANSKDRTQTLTLLTNSLWHRGPDDKGLWVAKDKKVGLGHRRLSIIDLSPLGKQPMSSKSGRFMTVFNGEIYNFLEIRKELSSFGHHFLGNSDTEVMLAAFEEWGINTTVKKLNGMFAMAVLDQQEHKLSLLRDRLGVKPIYFQWKDQTLYFSSELTIPFAKIGDRIINRESLALYFRYNYIPAPHTIYKGMYKLMPGIITTVTRESVSEERFASSDVYWDTQESINKLLSNRNDSMSMNEAVEMVETCLHESIKQRMIADVPLGAFLSGGIDSSLVVAHMQSLSTKPIKTFTIGFNDQSCNEAEHAKLIARHLGTEHAELFVTEADALKVIPDLPLMYGEPFADSSQIPTFLVSKLTRQTITVALSGDGGDELFAGYSSYQRLVQIQRTLSIIPSLLFAITGRSLQFRPIKKRLYSTFGDQYYEWFFNGLRVFARNKENLIPRGIHAEFSLPERLVLNVTPGSSILPYLRCLGNITEQMMCNDLMVYLPDDIMTKVDRASMAVSLEVRAPFVDDFRLFEVAWKTPFHHKANKEGGKLVLKEALARHIPAKLFERPKMGFGVPLGRWLNGPLKDWVKACVDPKRVRNEGYLNPVAIEGLTSKIPKEDPWYAYKLWAVCIFQSWLSDFHLKNN